MSDRSLEQRMNIKLCVKTGKSASETFFLLQQAYGEHSMDESSVFEWHQRLTEQENLLDQAKSAHRKPQKNTEANKNNGQNLVRSDPRLDVQIKSEEVKINREAVQQNAVEHLGMRNIPAKMEHRLLTEDDKKHRPGISPALFSNKENVSSVNEESPMETESSSGESVQCSQQEEELQNKGSASPPESGAGSREEVLFSPLKKIKDEPIDEDYDKALISSAHSDISRVKEELENGDHELSDTLDDLRISSVFSVRGNSDAITASVAAPQLPAFSAVTQPAPAIRPPPIVLQAQMQPQFQAHLQLQPKTLAQLQPHLQTQLQAQLQTHLQPQLQLQAQLQAQLQPQPTHQLQPQLSNQLQPQLSHQLQPQTQPPPPPQTQPTHQLRTKPSPQQQPPPAPVRICCSGCSKVLQKGQTAFQKKGSNQLFCSTVCLTGFNLPPAPIIAPKKTCHLCLKVIGNPKDLIIVPVDAANTLKEFCSLSCLSIYKSRVEGLPEENAVVRCSMCRNPSEIQHEVNHQGILHRLCSDDCFSRFRSSKRLSMSCCESCGNCTVTGNYHLVQIEDAVKKFCSLACISSFKQKSGKRVHCPCCQDLKAVDQMMEGTNAQGVIEFFCSSRCVANSEASCTLSGASFPCTNCQKLAVPQYHLAMPDGAIRNFCSYECVDQFQEKLHKSMQMNGGPYHSSNTDLHPSVPHHPSAQVCHPLPNAVPQNQNTASPYVPVSRLTNPQDPQQPEVLVPVKLTCKRCQKQFSSKPEVLQFKNHVGLFCSRFCCDMYKREKDVKAVCEYCKEEKVAKEIIVYEKQLRTFCCEGCKLLYKHDYARQHGGQWKVCAYCCNVTHKTIQNHFGGKLEEFCSEKCMSLYTVLFYEMAKCSACKNQGPLKESLRWDETARHFCNLQCLLHFCSKNILPDQPNSNGINPAATTAQAPLSLSKDVPVIGGVVSLASALAGNTALTGALPTSNASSKIIGDASTQTDASVNGDPQQRRMLKNKAVMCKPISDDQGIQSDLEPPKFLSETVIDENGEKIRLVPMPVPIPTPVFIPVPMHLYAQYTPVPLGFPLPIPVPLIWPASQDSAQASSTKGSVPSQSSVEDEDLDKGKSRPLSHADQGSTYSGDLESDARSTPFSWAEPDDSAHSHVKTPITLSELEGPKDAPATSTASCLLDLENDIPLASNDNDETKEQKYSAKRRKRGKRRSKVEELKNFKEELDVADCAQFILDSNLEKFTASSCQQDETLERSLSISPECAPIEDDLDEAENSEELNSSFKAMVSSLPSLKTGTEASCTKKQFCVYCKKSNSKIARHLTQMHSNETDVAYALNFPKNSKSRHVLLERLRKRGNYYHNVEVIRNGNEDIVLQKRTKRKRSSKDYLPCRYCLGFFVRNGLEKHEYSCRTKKLPEKFLESLQELDLKNESCFHTTREIDAPSFVNLIQLQNPGSSSESTSCPNLVSTLQSSLDRSLLTDQSSAEFSDQTDLKPGFGPSYMFSQSSPEPFLPTSSNFGRSPEANFCTSTCSPEPCPQSGFDSYFQFNDLSSPATNNANSNQSSVITDECNPPRPKRQILNYAYHPLLNPAHRLILNQVPVIQVLICASKKIWTRHQSTVLLPFQEGASGDLEEAIRRMKEDAVSKHIREDALICKYGARLFVNLKHRKKHQMYVSQRMRDLAKFMLAVKELDGSVQYLHHVCTLSRYDLVIKAAKIFCEFDESLSKFKRPSLAFRIGKSVRQAAEIVCGENVMEGNTETVADVKQFIKLLEKHWIFPAKNADWVNPDSSDVNGCLDKPTKALSSCQKKPPLRNRKSAFSAHRHGPKNEENVDSNEKLLCSNNAKESSTNPAVQSSMSHRSKSPSKSEVLTLKLRTARSKNKHFCLYCRKPVFKLARHLSLIHAKKKDVAHILSYPKGSKMRRCLFKQLLTKGNYQHNVRVQHTGKGEIIPIKRKQKDNSLKSHQACSFCLGFYHPSDLWRHLKSCRMKTDDTISCRRRSCSAPSKNFVLHESLSQGCQNVVRSMRDDKVSKYLRNDSLICKFGNRLYEEGDLCIPQKMRALGRFMLAVKELDPTVMDLNQVCTESRFDLASEAVKKVGGFEPNSRHKFKQSVALRIAFSLKCATEIALEEKGLGGKVRNQAKTFIKLLEKEWLLKEPSNPCKKTEENIIPLIEDVVKLQNYLKNFEDKAISELTEHPNCNSWKRLRESLLAELTLFNRERRSIAEKMLLQEYMQRDGNLIREKMCEPLTKLEQALNAVLITVGITCKDGSWIPVAFTARMAASLDILIKYRKDVGVPTHNPYMFPKMTTDSHIRAHDYIRIFARNCGVSKPEVHMHKQVATVFKIRSLNAIEKQQAAALVGDGAFDLQTPDENVSQLAKICNLLQTIEEGPEAQKVMGLGDSPRCKRQKWSPEEQEAVMRQLGNYISISKVPGKKDCLACIKTEFEALNKRTMARWTKTFANRCIERRRFISSTWFPTPPHVWRESLGQLGAVEDSTHRRFRFANTDEGEQEKKVLLGKRKRDDAEDEVEYGEMPENIEVPLRCPVRLYEFYLSKCPDSVKERPDVFYLQPEISCHPGSSVWYSTKPLDAAILDAMLSRALAVRDVHLEPKQQQQQPSCSDEDTS
ncbi:Zinc finger MYM-type protein 4 [Bagarius yarrelli]|uniref:Zinc finger MYM-type protein 4 n=1 Tax=Bagarius yarrelli TaxID=175774 RepID=A0A556TUP0_BAGYA|nr:Zinc finger MYM-type protein 4 [Bagarius yarrelli]